VNHQRLRRLATAFSLISAAAETSYNVPTGANQSSDHASLHPQSPEAGETLVRGSPDSARAVTPANRERLKPLLDHALGLSAGERAKFVERIRAEDEELGRALAQKIADAHAEAVSETRTLNTPPNPEMHPPGRRTFAEGELVLGRFRIVRFLGKGGMGEVYEADDLQLGKVALKTIRPEMAASLQNQLRFRQEVQLGRLIANPHVCRVYHLFDVPARPNRPPASFLTMEFLPGRTLADRIQHGGPLPLTEADSIAAQVCSALEAIHDADIIHRDFKPNNVMLVPRKGKIDAVVMDMGLARNALPAEDGQAGLTLTGAIMGTPEYMAPEQLLGQPVTPATDIYALGVVLYEMVTGQRPFSGATPVAAAVMRAKKPLNASSLRPDLSRRWDDVINRCLKFEPEARFQSAAEVAAALHAPPDPIKKFSGKRKKMAAASAFILLAGSGLVWRQSQPSNPPAPAAQHWYDEGVAALRDGTFYKATQALSRAVDLDKNFILAHARLADAWAELDFTGKAKDEMLRASSLELKKSLPYIDRQYVDAVRATLTWDYASAVQNYKNILKSVPPKDKAYAWVDLGRAQEKAGDIAEAARDYAEAARLAPEYPAAFVHLGILRSRLGKRDEGDAAFSRADALYRTASNPEGVAEVAYQRGYVAALNGDTGRARPLLEQALHAARDIPSVQLEIRALTRMSAVETLADNTDKAIDLANQSILRARENGLDYWAADGLIWLADAWLNRSDFAKAEPQLQEALRLARENQRSRLEANANLTLASIRNQQDKPDDVVNMAQAALNYYQKAGFVAETASALNLIARSERDKANYNAALPRAIQSLDLANQSKNPVSIRQMEELVGTILLQMENYPDALAHLQNALSLARSMHQDVEYQTLHCADALWRMGRYDEARQMLDSLPPEIASRPRIAIQIKRINAEMLLSEQNHSKAFDLARQSLANADSASTDTRIDLLLVAGTAAAQSGKKKEAGYFCQTALDAATEQRSPELTAEAGLCRADAFLVADMPALALPLAESAYHQFVASGQLESQSRTLLKLSEIAKKSGDSAKSKEFSSKALDVLSMSEHNWGNAAFETWSRRPDIGALRKKLSGAARN
jgi:serine/threonine protein kinase